MQAHRALIETDENGRPKELPVLPPHARVEAIFLVLDEQAQAASPRRPPPSLAGIKILGDIVAPAIDEGDWSLGVVISLDTHAWLWWAQANPTELPAGARDCIAQADVVAVASVSCLEVAWLAKKGRISLPMPIEAFFDDALDKAGLVLLPLPPVIAARSADLPELHRDPIDRVMIATAMAHGAELLSRDRVVATYPDVRVVWDR